MKFVKKLTQARFLGECFTRKSVNYSKCQIATKQKKIINGNLALDKLTWVYLPWIIFLKVFCPGRLSRVTLPR